jgi:hypothetical protein
MVCRTETVKLTISTNACGYSPNAQEPLTNLFKLTENKFALTLSDDPILEPAGGSERRHKTDVDSRPATLTQYASNTYTIRQQHSHQTLPLSIDVEMAPKTLQARTHTAVVYYSSEGQ